MTYSFFFTSLLWIVLLGVGAVAVRWSLRAGEEPALDEVVSASGIRLALQDAQAGAEEPVSVFH
jgi:hypothetical protein